ncbi:MAG: substrate-binding domain-containing protein [bacterium]
MKRIALFWIAVCILFSMPLPSVSAEDAVRIRMASTTSTQNSGLLDVLFPAFEKATGGRIKVDLIAVGTGQALEIAERGDADLVFVHAPELEEEFVKNGFGVNRHPVMHNDFVVLGPASDPAGVKDAHTAIDAFQAIAKQKALFISRGDRSGTHLKELAVWDKAGVNPKGEAWYIEAGSGMAAALRVAEEKRAYTLSDRGTYLNYRTRISLGILFQGDPALYNPYGIMAVNPKRFPHVHYKEAMRFIEWILSPEAQSLIASYQINGEQLFYPDARGN